MKNKMTHIGDLVYPSPESRRTAHFRETKRYYVDCHGVQFRKTDGVQTRGNIYYLQAILDLSSIKAL